MVQKYSERATSSKKREKGRNTCGCRGACISKNDLTKGRGFSERKRQKRKTKQNKRNTTRGGRHNICKSNSRRTKFVYHRNVIQSNAPDTFNMPDGRSLSWMGLTRESWCCTGGYMSRLDMNTYQTSIKTDILFSAAVTQIPGLSDRHKITILVPTELN